MKWKFQTAGRLLALLALSGALLAAPLPAQAAPGVLTGLTGTGSKLELELTEMELECTILKQKGPVAVAEAKATVGGQLAVSAELTFALAKDL